MLLNGHRYIMSVLCFNILTTRRNRRDATGLNSEHRVLASASDVSPSVSHQNGISRVNRRLSLNFRCLQDIAKHPKARRLACWQFSARHNSFRRVEHRYINILAASSSKRLLHVILISSRSLLRPSYSLACRFHRDNRDPRKKRTGWSLHMRALLNMSHPCADPRCEISSSKCIGHNFKSRQKSHSITFLYSLSIKSLLHEGIIFST